MTCIRVLFFLIGSVLAMAVASPSGGYESVQTLNEYGNAVQLEHASKAAAAQGRTLVVVQRPTTHWIVSVNQARALHHRKSPALAKWLYSPLLGSSSGDSDEDRTPLAYQALVYSGVNADGQWLVSQLRVACQSNWERYDSFGSSSMILHCLRDLLQRFWKYEDKEMPRYGHTILSSMDQSLWARPLGVQVALLSCEGKKTSVHFVGPSGLVTKCSQWICMGQQSEIIDHALQRSFRGLDWQDIERDSEIREKLKQVISETINCQEDDVCIQAISEATSPQSPLHVPEN